MTTLGTGPDDDNDNTPDEEDANPTDGDDDGTPDEEDVFPDDPTESEDNDAASRLSAILCPPIKLSHVLRCNFYSNSAAITISRNNLCSMIQG